MPPNEKLCEICVKQIALETRISDVFFDLDHTLWDFEKNSALAFKTIFEEHSLPIDLDEFLLQYVPINAKYWEMYRKDEITQQELRLNRIKDSFALLNYLVSAEDLMILSEKYIEYLPKHNHLFEGTISILDYLQPKYNLHIITNGFHVVQEQKLTNSNIRHYFKTVTNSETAGVKKPNPVIYSHALHVANAKKENSIMIGDCIDADVLGALNSGLDAILFNGCGATVSNDVKQINSLIELKKYL